MKMSKTLKLISLISIGLLAVFIFNAKSTNNGLAKSNTTNNKKIDANASIETVNSKQNNLTKTEVDKTELENNSEFEIDLQLSKDLATTLIIKDSEQKLSEIIRLADEYPENTLLQYLAATNCLQKKQAICDAEKFTRRMLKNNPTNATAKSFLAAIYLKHGDSESALAELLNINTDDTYSSFFYETTQSLEPAFNEKLEAKYSLAKDQFLPLIEAEKNHKLDEQEFNNFMNYAIHVGTIGIAVTQLANTDSTRTCLTKLKVQATSQRWIEPCMNLAKAMITSETSIDQGLGYALQSSIYEIQSDEANLIKIQALQNERKLIYEAATKILNNEDFLMSGKFELYYRESTALGEHQAMINLVEREGI